MKYNTVFPYFSKDDIDTILGQFRDVLAGNGLLTMGSAVQEFEKNFAHYLGVPYAVATNSCTSALEIALRCIEFNPGDEVIVPVQTFIATGSCVVNSGGKVVFCEIDENFLLDFEDLKRRITSKTRAVMMVHFCGLIHPQIMQIKDFLKKRGIVLIEDAAHAPGAKIDGVFAGTIGDIGCFSFFSTKIITTGEGGMFTTQDQAMAKKASSLRNRGLDVDAGREIYSRMGGNRRMSEIQGILGRQHLKSLETFLTRRNQLAEIYRGKLRSLVDRKIIRFQDVSRGARHAYWRFLVFLQATPITRDVIRQKMAESEVVIDWPYDPMLPFQPVFQNLYGTKPGDFPRSENLSQMHFCLPLHMGLNESDIEFIADRLLEVF